MSRVAVIGEALRVQGFALAGVLVCAAGDKDQAVTAWRSLPTDVTVAILTPHAAQWLAGAPGPSRGAEVLTVVMPP